MLSELYRNIKILISQITYTKEETNSVIDDKFETLSTVATSGSYTDLTDKPSVPTKTSDLTNDSGFLTTQYKNVFYGTCSTGASTQTKVVIVDDWDFVIGNILFVKFEAGNSYDGTAKLSIDEVLTDVVTVGSTKTSRYFWKTGEVVGFVYDGENMVMVEKATATTTYYGITKLSNSVTSTSEALSATPKAVKTAYDLASGKADSIHTHSVEDINDFPSTITPSTHTHGNITDTGAIGTTANLPVITGTNGVLQTGAFGTSANTFAQGNHTHSQYAPTNHNHDADSIIDSNSEDYSFNLSSNSRQQEINRAISDSIENINEIISTNIDISTLPCIQVQNDTDIIWNRGSSGYVIVFVDSTDYVDYLDEHKTTLEPSFPYNYPITIYLIRNITANDIEYMYNEGFSDIDLMLDFCESEYDIDVSSDVFTYNTLMSYALEIYIVYDENNDEYNFYEGSENIPLNQLKFYTKTETDNLLSSKINVSDVKDNLTSTDTNKPLSANQGKELKTLINNKANSSHSHGVIRNDGTLSTSQSTSYHTTYLTADSSNNIVVGNHLRTSVISNSSALSNIGSSANASQSSINSNINTKLGDKLEVSDLLDLIYPVGAIYLDANSHNICPIETILGGTWTKIESRFLVGSNTTGTDIGNTGGESSHTLTVNEMPSHSHRISSGWQSASGTDRITFSQVSGSYQQSGTGGTWFIEMSGGGQAHNNMPPYIVVDIWKRTE